MITIYDLDDTLYDLTAAFKRSHAVMFKGYPKEVLDRFEGVDLDALFATVKRHSNVSLQMTITGELDPKDEFAYRFSHAYSDFGVELTRDELDRFEVIYRSEQKHIYPFDGTVDMLRAWGDVSDKMALLTNGIPKVQVGKFLSLGLDDIIPTENVYVSGAIGYRKPDVRAFLKVADILKNGDITNYKNFVMIGDTYEADMVGAIEAGFTTVWFNHRHKTIPAGGQSPDYTVETIKELIDLAPLVSKNLP